MLCLCLFLLTIICAKQRRWRSPPVATVIGSLVTLLVALALMTPARSEFVPGGIFAETCRSQASDRRAACIAYIAGVVDSNLRTGHFCLPPNVSVNEISTFVIDYAIKNISLQRTPAYNIVMLALKARWPCINKPKMVFQFQLEEFLGGQRR